MSDPVKVHSDLKNILSRSEFRMDGSLSNNPLTQAIKYAQKQWDVFKKWFNGLFEFAGQFGSLGKVFVYAILALLLVGAAWVLARVLREYFHNRALQSVGQHTVFDEDEPDDSVSHDANVWISDAEAMAQAGDYRRAYRAVFVATLMYFEVQEIVVFQRGTTNGEYYTTVRSKTSKTVTETFRTFIIGFDTRWYGGHETTEADYSQALAFYTEIRNALASKQADNGAQSLALEGT